MSISIKELKNGTNTYRKYFRSQSAEQATQVLKADASVETMPATDEGLQKALLARDDYKDRAARDKAAER